MEITCNLLEEEEEDFYLLLSEFIPVRCFKFFFNKSEIFGRNFFIDFYDVEIELLIEIIFLFFFFSFQCSSFC